MPLNFNHKSQEEGLQVPFNTPLTSPTPDSDYPATKGIASLSSLKERKPFHIKPSGPLRCLLIGPTLFFDTIEDGLASDEMIFYRHYSLDALYFSLKPKFDVCIMDTQTYRQLEHPIYKNLHSYLQKESIFVVGEHISDLPLWDFHTLEKGELTRIETSDFHLGDLAMKISKAAKHVTP